MDEQQKDEAMRTIYLGGPQNEISQPKMETARQSGPQNRKPAGKKIFRRWPILALALVVVLAVILLGLFWPGAKKVNSYKDKWQTVFLNNGQVYFGHIVFENEQAVVLQDV